jgi:hypothetical protein
MMKRLCNLKMCGLVVILAVSLVFIGISFAQGQGKGKGKKPPSNKTQYVWKVVILDQAETGFGIRGIEAARYDETWPGWVYEDTEANVNVDVRIGSAPYGGEIKYTSVFDLEIFKPNQIDLEFVPWNAWFYPDTPEARCKYPGGYDPFNPFSMFDFMQDQFHPQPEYDRVKFIFKTDRSVNSDDIDYEQWAYHDIMHFLASIKTPPMTYGASTCEELNLSEYSSIEFGSGDYGYFERLDQDTWKVVVGQEILPPYDYTGPGEIDEDDAWAYDFYQYCVLTQINKKKTSASYDAVFSAQGQFDIKFAVLFIRTKI